MNARYQSQTSFLRLRQEVERCGAGHDGKAHHFARRKRVPAFVCMWLLSLFTMWSAFDVVAKDRPVFLDVSHLFPEWTNSAKASVLTNDTKGANVSASSSPVTPAIKIPPVPVASLIPEPVIPISPAALETVQETPVTTTTTSLPAAASTNGMDALDEKHLLAIGDRLSFRIVEDEEEPKPLYVTDSGELEVPLLGRFPALGKSCKDLARALKAEFEKEYYYQATVILAVDLMTKSRGKVYLVGPVRAPGPQDVPSDEVLTLSKAVLRAGGFTEYADRKNVKVTRKSTDSGEKDQTFTVNVAEILEKGRTESDLPLQPGDLVYVPERLIRF